MEEYLESYVDHFNLRPRFQLNSKVKSVIHEDADDMWRVDVEGSPPRYFDRVVMATGPHVRPMMPTIEGSHLFKGRIAHSRAFKRYLTTIPTTAGEKATDCRIAGLRTLKGSELSSSAWATRGVTLPTPSSITPHQ